MGIPKQPVENDHCPNPQFRFSKMDLVWTMNLFGTAVGAGILFLPINLGINKMFMVIFLGFLALPMTYLAHKALCHFVLSSSNHGANITDVAHEHFGNKSGRILTWCYFLSIYPIMMIYSVGITNTIESFWVNQLQGDPLNRLILSIAVVSILFLVINLGEAAIIKFTSLLVYPLILALLFVSCYLIPRWNFNIAITVPDSGSFFSSLWFSIPVLIFAFNHAAIISSFAKAQHIAYGDKAVNHADKILKLNSICLLVFTMFFVFSTLLSIDPDRLILAKQQNISVTSFLANELNDPLLDILGPLIAMVAMMSSFFGHYLGSKEGIKSLLSSELPKNKQLNEHQKDRFTLWFLFITLLISTYFNPNILNLMEYISGPITAIILFIMPAYAVMIVPRMKPYRCYFRHGFIFIIGLIGLSSIIAGIIR